MTISTARRRNIEYSPGGTGVHPFPRGSSMYSILCGGTAWNSGLMFLDSLRQERRQRHKPAATNHGGQTVVVEQMAHHPTETQRCQDLRGHDEEVEDAHVDANFGGRQGARQHRVG